MRPIISALEVSKKYALGNQAACEDSLREMVAQALRFPRRLLFARADVQNGEDSRWIWALRDITFDVKPGETIGFIGANGAGKSTLLKILSRITAPTSGEVRLRGRLASLLEVGTGFHPELTGRENIFLNGTMLGMRKAEVRAKFDEIVAFAEMQKFIDTPVKRYSSGMYVRLAFAVAAHLDPEILVVDEVLAVGDMAFQKKCMGKMGDFGRSGRTVLFVSHNMAAVENLCQRGIFLRNGRVVFDGTAKETVLQYIEGVSDSYGHDSHSVDLTNAPRPNDVEGGALKRLDVFGSDGQPFRGFLPIGGGLRFMLVFDLPKATEDFDPRINITDLYGRIVYSLRSSFEVMRNWGIRTGRQEFVCEVPQVLATPGEYRIAPGLAVENKWLDYIEQAMPLTIMESNYYGTGTVPKSGVCVVEHHWRPA